MEFFINPCPDEGFTFFSGVWHCCGCYTPERKRVKIFFSKSLKKMLTGVKHPAMVSGMSTRTGKFIGAYIPKDVKTKLQKEAKDLDRPLSWVIEKILADGVKHLKGGGRKVLALETRERKAA